MENNFEFKSFLDEFYKVVDTFPDSIAIATETEKISYTYLNKRIINISQILSERGITKEDVVILWMEKSPEYIKCLLAIWRIGAVYLPLDAKTPVERVIWIANDANAKAVITDNELLLKNGFDELKTGNSKENITPIIFDFKDLRLLAKSSEQKKDHNEPILQANDTAYIIYTSGSTGNPKGVVIPHEGIINFLKEQTKLFQVNSKSKILQYLSVGFDASLSEIGISLLSGAEIRIEQEEKIKNPKTLIEILIKEEITHICLPPSLLPVLPVEKMPSSLETIIIGGEVCPVDTVREWTKKFRIVNVYGPTEATVCSSLTVCGSNWSKPLIGNPIPNRSLHILGENLQLLKDGESGELYLSGVGLAKKYLNQKKLTEEKIIFLNGIRLYKTGDLVVCHGKGEIEFLGRVDRQFKLRGNLIEPYEVEQLLSAYPKISFAHVMKQTLKREILVAYLVLKENNNSHESMIQMLKEYLKKRLPYWMVPEHFVFLEKIPMNFNEKLDVKSLPLVKPTRPAYLTAYKEPRTERERKLCSIFSELLCIEPIGVEDDFFMLGGDSISTISILTQCSLLGISLSAEKFIRNPTVAGILDGNQNEMLHTSNINFLKKEAFLDSDLKQAIQSARLVENKFYKILMTGATGFLGSRILFELSQTFEAEIYCIVRNISTSDPKKKIEDVLSKQGIQISNWEKIFFLEGDISRPGLGLSEFHWDYLASKIDSVFHFAAEVNLVLSYENLRAANVDSTREILKFCNTRTRKYLHYASTLSVFVSSDDPRNTFYEKDELNTMIEVYGGYAQTKWVSEKMLLNAKQVGFDSISIYRFGLITGESKLGYGKIGDFFAQFLISILTLKAIPTMNELDLKVDITPVDFAAKACIAIASSAGNNRIFHIANPNPLRLADLISILNELGIQIAEISIEEFIQKYNPLGFQNPYFYLSISRSILDRDAFTSVNPLDLFQATGSNFDFANTQEIFPYYFLECPLPNKDLIYKYLEQLQWKEFI